MKMFAKSTVQKRVSLGFQGAKLALLGMLFLSGLLSACGKSEAEVEPATIAPPPNGVAGKWMYGSFSPTSFWGTDGKSNGAAYEQAMAFSFSSNGTYEMYVVNATTYYNCRTGAYTYWKGKAVFNEANHSLTLTPAQGNYRGEYSCTPNSNFKREATADEVARAAATYYYSHERDANGNLALRLYFTESDKQGAQFTPGSW